MPKKVSTPWEIAKPLLEELYLAGKIKDDWPRAKVHKLRKVFEDVPINNFGKNWLRMKNTIGSMKRSADRDLILLQADRLVHPIDPNRWDGSEAQALLKQDIDNEFHLWFCPKELYLSREEYKKFDFEVFGPHVYQEIRSKKETNYWLVKKAKKVEKKKKNDEFDPDQLEFFDESY